MQLIKVLTCRIRSKQQMLHRDADDIVRRVLSDKLEEHLYLAVKSNRS